MQLFRTPHPAKRGPTPSYASQMVGGVHLNAAAGLVTNSLNFVLPRNFLKSFNPPIPTIPAAPSLVFPTIGSSPSYELSSIQKRNRTNSDDLSVATVTSTTSQGSMTGGLVHAPGGYVVHVAQAVHPPGVQGIQGVHGQVVSGMQGLSREYEKSGVTTGGFKYCLAPPESDEEAVVVESPCTLVMRSHPAPVTVTAYPSYIIQDWCVVSSTRGRVWHRRLAAEQLGFAFITPLTVLSIAVLTDKLLFVYGTGVVEAYRYFTAENAKSCLLQAAAAPIQNKRVYIRWAGHCRCFNV